MKFSILVFAVSRSINSPTGEEQKGEELSFTEKSDLAIWIPSFGADLSTNKNGNTALARGQFHN